MNIVTSKALRFAAPLAILAAVAFTSNARAIIILGPPGDIFFQQGGNVTADDVEAETGFAGQLTEVYKQNVGGAEESASFGPSYTTTFQPATDPKGFTVTYVGGPFITGDPIWILAKDGSTGHYLWDISGWDGMEQIVASGLYPNGGAVSHISIYTGQGGGGQTGVPDGGSTVALLGLALGALALVRRKLA